MMATTHVFAGLALAAAVAVAAPEFGLVAAVAAVLGGLFPDFDLYAGHRKTLHFPVYYAALSVPAILLALVAPGPATVGLALFLLAAALHAATDLLGGGLELRPWEGTSDRAVYSHYHGRWFEPKRWVRYDGAPEDLGVAAALAVPSLYVFDSPVRELALGFLAVSAAYATVRKHLARVWEALIERLPTRLLAYAPHRFHPTEGDAFDGRTEPVSDD